MTSEAELIYDELDLGERMRITQIIGASKSLARTISRSIHYVSQNIEKYREQL